MRRLRSSSIKSRGAVFLALLVCLFGSVAVDQPWDGNGVEGDPYQIWTAADMQAIGADANYWDAHFKLMADIDLSAYTGTAFHIIGTDYDNPFTGAFDGNGHIVSNFTYTSTGTDYIALFGDVGTDGEIKNLGMVDANVDAGTGYYVSGLVGLNDYGIVSNCYATGSVTGDDYVGGLVGLNYYDGTVSNCYAASTVSGVSWVGGLVGINHFGTVSNCYATGNVFGSGSVGGLVGYNNYGTVSKCYATGTVSGVAYVGGLVGWNNSTISNCYATGSVSGNSIVGGLVGYDYFGTVTASFWDIDTSGQATSAGGTGKTTIQMQTESTFTDAGWDFVWESVNGTGDIWTICEGVDYPKLTWQFIIGDFDGDDDVDFADFAIFAAYWLEADSSFWCGGTDLTNDNQVGLDDLREFVANWLAGM